MLHLPHSHTHTLTHSRTHSHTGTPCSMALAVVFVLFSRFPFSSEAVLSFSQTWGVNRFTWRPCEMGLLYSLPHPKSAIAVQIGSFRGKTWNTIFKINFQPFSFVLLNTFNSLHLSKFHKKLNPFEHCVIFIFVHYIIYLRAKWQWGTHGARGSGKTGGSLCSAMKRELK